MCNPWLLVERGRLTIDIPLDDTSKSAIGYVVTFVRCEILEVIPLIVFTLSWPLRAIHPVGVRMQGCFEDFSVGEVFGPKVVYVILDPWIVMDLAKYCIER